MNIDLPDNIESQKTHIINGDYSHVELVDEYLRRIKDFDKNINSFITVLADDAYKQAKKCDKLFAEKGVEVYEKYKLFGVTVSLKDLFSLKGIRTTAGSKVLSDNFALYDATVVKKLKESGCIFIGKTNCDAWAHGASGENSDFGPTKNPWNYDYVPGGSSSGSASSVASNFCMFSMGTDTGGSIRQPANFCGVVGLKPSYGSVSRYGIIAMSSSLDSVGHFTNNVSDSESVFKITKGLDNFDATLNDDKNIQKKAKFKLGVPYEYFTKGIDKNVENELHRVIDLYKKCGIEIVNNNLPLTKYAISVYYIIQPSEVSSNLGRYDGIRYGNSRDVFGAEAKRRIMLGTFALSSGYYDQYYLKAMKVRYKITEEFAKAFESVDAIIAPVSPTPPFKLEEKTQDPLKMYLADIYTVAANIAGLPGLAIPSNYTNNGLPLGFQLIGKKFNENILFELGKIFEKNNIVKIKKPSLV